MAARDLCARSCLATLLHFNRSRRTTLFAPELRELTETSSIEAVSFYDDEGAPRLNTGLLSPYLHDRTVDVYACAPEGFLQSAERLCVEVGLNPEQIHLERFTAPELAIQRPEGQACDASRSACRQGAGHVACASNASMM